MKNQLPGIQILRAVAAIGVVFLHFTGQVVLYDHKGTPWLHHISHLGASGVDIFFVISGFIMFYTTRNNPGGIAGGLDFLKRRATRIFPPYWVWTGIAIVLWAAHLGYTSQIIDLNYLARSMLLIPTYVGNDWSLMLAPGWTLTYEAYFYCVFAVALMITSYRFVPLFAFLVISAAFVLSRQFGFSDGVNHIVGDGLVFEFIFGALAAYVSVWCTEHIDKSRRQQIGMWSLTIGAAAMIVTLIWDLPMEMRALYWGIPATFVVFGGSITDFKKLYERNELIFLGNASYSIYLSHHLPMMLFASLIKKGWFTKIPADMLVIAGVAGAVTIGSIAYVYIEKPINALFGRKKPIAVVIPPSGPAPL